MLQLAAKKSEQDVEHFMIMTEWRAKKAAIITASEMAFVCPTGMV